MDTNLTHLDQYKMLREEIMQNVREMGRLEVAGAAAAGGAYTWLLTHGDSGIPHAAWFIIPWVLAFCSFRIFDLTRRIQLIAAYLQLIEKAAFGEDSTLPGWERYKTNTRHRQYDLLMAALTAVFWGLSIAAAFYVYLHTR